MEIREYNKEQANKIANYIKTNEIKMVPGGSVGAKGKTTNFFDLVEDSYFGTKYRITFANEKFSNLEIEGELDKINLLEKSAGIN